MRALLVQQGLQDALLGEKNLPSTMQEKQTPAKDVEGSYQLQFEVDHETLQPEKFANTSSKTIQEEIVHERQDEPT